MCEWLSIMPGIRSFPPASITVAPAGIGTLAPTATTFPARTTIVPFGIGAPAAV
jgi:hypothetical protein